MRSATPTAVQPRHRNDSKLTARRPPGHGPRPPRLGTRDRQPLLKTRPAQSPGIISRAATAARPRLGSGKDLQSRKEFKFGSGGGGGRAAGTHVNRQTAVTAKQANPHKDQSSRQCMSVRQTMLQGTGPGPIGATRHTRVVARNVAATLSRLTGRSRASGLRPSEITRQRSRRPPTIALHRNN